MIKLIGVNAKFECPACGNIIVLNQPLIDIKGGKKIAGPTKCGCGRSGNFTLLSFKQIKLTIVPEGFELKKKEEAK